MKLVNAEKLYLFFIILISYFVLILYILFHILYSLFYVIIFLFFYFIISYYWKLSMSPIQWNEQKQVPNFAIGKHSSPLVENNSLSRRSSGASDYERIVTNAGINVVSSSNDDLLAENGKIIKGSKRLVAISHPAVDVPLCVECKVKSRLLCIPNT